MKYLGLILILFLTLKGYSCSCPPQNKFHDQRVIEYEGADIILIGDVTLNSKDKNLHEIKILEIFKGEHLIKCEFLEGINSKYCYPTINENGKWLIYGRIEEGFFKLNDCGLSRSFKRPHENSYFHIIESMMKFKNPKINMKMVQEKVVEISKQELTIEVGILRDLKKCP